MPHIVGEADRILGPLSQDESEARIDTIFDSMADEYPRIDVAWMLDPYAPVPESKVRESSSPVAEEAVA